MGVGGNFIQELGSLDLDSCTAQKSGGGLQVNGSFHQKRGKVDMKGCQARQLGGGMNIHHNITIGGSSTFTGCQAGEGWFAPKTCTACFL